MTDKVEEKVISLLDALQSGVAHIGDQVVKYSPDVADAALWVVRIDGLGNLLIGLLGLGMIAVSHALFRKAVWHRGQHIIAWRAYIETKGKEERIQKDDADYHDFWRFITLLTSGFSGFAGLIAVARFLDIWNWVAVFEPKLFIAKQIIDAALK